MLYVLFYNLDLLFSDFYFSMEIKFFSFPTPVHIQISYTSVLIAPHIALQ